MTSGHSDSLSTQSAGGALLQRIMALPFLPRGSPHEDRLADWLATLGDPAVAQDLARVFQTNPKSKALLQGLGEYSPHLWKLATSDAGRLLRVLTTQPESHFKTLIEQISGAVRACSDEAEVMRLLRAMKAEAALLIGLTDIGGVWPIMTVTHALTELADTAVQSAVHFLLGEAVRRGKLDPSDPGHPERGSGYIVLGMGKMGAFELNYSSDIDLIIFFDPAAPGIAAGAEAQSVYIRMSRSLVKLLQQREGDDYVFRVDVRLRPDPAATHIAISTIAALEYYETRGQNWERSAMIKARQCAGDFAAGERFLRDLAPFVWRKHMDFAALSDIHAMKRQINAYKGHGEVAVSGHNIKLGRGGIREIEFFVQTQQLVAGGRNPHLRERATLPMLHELANDGWIAQQAATELEAAYLFLRKVEHRLQMVSDEQTHTLPAPPAELERFAHFLGFAATEDFAATLLRHLRIVQDHYARLFEQGSDRSAELGLNFPKEADDGETLDKLVGMGFRNPLEISALVRKWLSGVYPALKSDFNRMHLLQLVPSLLDHVARSDSRDATFVNFDRFLANLQARSAGSLFSLLQQNRELLSLILLILGTAPRLADILAHQPAVLDGLLDPALFGTIPDTTILRNELARTLDQADGYEDFLDRLRLFGQEHMFLIGARVLSGTIFAGQAGEAFASLADVIIHALTQATERRFAEAHGRVTGQQIAILAMGKLGGREMTATSDLDLIVVYDFEAEHPQSDGLRPLYGHHYFARFTQRLISALTAPTNYGALYQVDMRLRPSGRSGPVATQIEGFRSYQETEAWTWEHMALTRARVVSADAGFTERVEAAIHSVLRQQRDAVAIAGDAFEMRQAIAKEKGDGDRWDLKYAAGGLIDVEFIAQYLQLVHAADHPDILDTSTIRVLDKAARLGLISAEDSEALRPAIRLYLDLSQILRLCLTVPFDPKTAGTGLLGLLTRAADVPDFATLEAHLAETQLRVRKSFLKILGQEE